MRKLVFSVAIIWPEQHKIFSSNQQTLNLSCKLQNGKPRRTPQTPCPISFTFPKYQGNIPDKFQGPPQVGPSATHTNPIPLPFQNPLIYGNDMVSLWEGGPLIEGPWSILNAAPYHRHHWKMQERTWHTERHAVPPSSSRVASRKKLTTKERPVLLLSGKSEHPTSDKSWTITDFRCVKFRYPRKKLGG